MVVKRGEVWRIQLDPTVGKEIRKTRPCLIISPDEANLYLDTVIAAPLTSTIRNYPSRIDCIFKRKKGQVALDQLRTIDKQRLVGKVGVMESETLKKVFETLNEYFEY